MKVVLAPQAFKGSLSGLEVAHAMREGLLRVVPAAATEIVPMADGGEGTVRALVDATGGELHEAAVTGPLGERRAASLGVLGDGATAVIEMAAASGLPLVPPQQRDPRITTTRGTGDLIRAALDLLMPDRAPRPPIAHRSSPPTLIIGIGGSATNDAGAGMLQALGARLLDAEGHDLPPGGAALARLARIDLSGLDPRLADVRVRVACDVSNPLCGPTGASATYGPQKGATPEMVEELDTALARFAEVAEATTGKRVRDVPGAGAAGGLGAGLLAFLNGTLEPGVAIVLEAVQLERRLRGAQLAITGEGQVDWQTVYGKAPIGVAQTARRLGIPVVALCGALGKDYAQVFEHGLDAVFTIEPGPMTLDEAMAAAGTLITDATERALRLMLAGSKVDWHA